MGFQDRYSTPFIPFDEESQKMFGEHMNQKIWGNKCGATIWGPRTESNFVEDRAFSLYAMECEGEIPTRRGKLNQVAKMLVAAGPEANDFAKQCEIYDAVGNDSDTFTDDEIIYITREVERLCKHF